MGNKLRLAITVAAEWDSLRGALGTNADWAREQDTAFRFTRLAGNKLEGDPELASEQLLACTRWDWDLSDGTTRVISISGMRCDDEGGQ